MNASVPEVLFAGDKNVSIISGEDYPNYTEETEFNKNGQLESISIFTMVLYGLFFVLGVTGNGLVIFITGFRMKKTVNTVFFLNLAIADFTFTFFLPLNIMYIAWGFQWPLGEAMCKLNYTLTFLNLYASVYLLMVISIDRCISVRCPVWAQNHRTPRLASFVALGVWILALVLCSPNMHFKKTDQSFHEEMVTICVNDYGNNSATVKITRQAVIISRFIFAFVIPFSVIVFCYAAIVLRIRAKRLSQSSKPFKVITAVIVAFFLCWFPYHVFLFLEMVALDHPHLRSSLDVGSPLTYILIFLNSCLNPILYFFMGHNFKDRLRCSILLTFEKAFAEEANQSNTTKTGDKSSTQVESQNL